MEKLRRDSLLMGIFLGIALPAIVFGIIYGILVIVFAFSSKKSGIPIYQIVSMQKLILLSVIPNLFLLKYYLTKLKLDKTGRGILAATFLIGIAFVILEFI